MFRSLALCFAAMLPWSAYAYDKADVHIMAEAVYFEARDQERIGQYAVACTIKARVEKRNWPDTVAGVVYQYLQFSYFWDGLPEVIAERKAYNIAHVIAEDALNTNVCVAFDGADHYINHKLSTKKWHVSMKHIANIQDHSLYRRDKS